MNEVTNRPLINRIASFLPDGRLAIFANSPLVEVSLLPTFPSTFALFNDPLRNQRRSKPAAILSKKRTAFSPFWFFVFNHSATSPAYYRPVGEDF